MKTTRAISGLTGFFLPLLIGRSIEIPDGIFLVWICLFAFGFIGMLLLQVFENPFLNTNSNRKIHENHMGILNFASSITLFLGVGALFGELTFFQTIGVLSVSLIIFGISIFLGTHYLNVKNWFFNQ